ncbi:MAG TPA: AhpC/TSA family protein [Nitriliruptorales bacterium]|nr:AhpC/TSA family protein [Nitriliruptorales bacterium]
MKVHERRERIEGLDATAVFVGFDEPERLRRLMLRDVDLIFPFAVDRDRRAYRAWGLRRVPWRVVWLDPRVWWQYGRLLLGGERLRSTGEDTLQMGGDFVVAPDGTVAYARPQNRDDRPPVGELIATVADLR